MATIRIGTRMPFDGLLDSPSPRVFADDPEMARHAGMPWVSDYLLERYGVLTGKPPEATLRPFDIQADDLRYHAVIVGAIGSGKSRLALHLLREQLREGCSAIVIDVKEDTVRQAISCAEAAGMSPDQVTVLWPQEQGGGMPEWNLLAGQPDQAVATFMEALNAVYLESWGPRLSHLLRNAATVCAAQGLSIKEVVECLKNAGYREGLLQRARATGAWDRYPEQHASLETSFHDLSASSRRDFAGPVLNKVETFVANPWLNALTCAEGDTLDIPGLWKRPRLIAVHLDGQALWGEGVTLLAALLARYAYAAAMRRPGDVPVVFFLDELDTHERNVGATLTDIILRARSQGLRLIAATQTLRTVSPALIDQLLDNTWLRAFFNMGAKDADRVAETLVTGNGSRPLRIHLSVEKEGGFAKEETASYPVLAADGTRIAIRADAWAEAKKRQKAKDMVRFLLRTSGIHGATAARLPLEEALGYVADTWDGFDGPDPLKIRVKFPRPQYKELGRATQDAQAGELSQLLQGFPPRRAVVRLRDGTTGLVQATRTDFPDPLPLPTDWMRAGQPDGKPAATARRRAQAIAALTVQAPAKPSPAPKAAAKKATPAPPPIAYPPPAKPGVPDWAKPTEDDDGF